MKTIHEIKHEREARNSALFEKVGLFFAFNPGQFAEGKARNPVPEGEKYTSIGMGGYLPKANVDRFLDGMKEINTWFKTEVNAHKETRRSLIAYELDNHEAYYTGSIDDTVDALGDDFTRAEVRKVYNEERIKEMA